MTDQLLASIGESREPGETRSSVRQAAKQLETAVADLFSVHDVTLGIQGQPETIRLRGHLQVSSEHAYPKIAARFREMGYTAVLRHDEERNLDELLAVPGVLPQVEHSRLWVHALLLGATVLTTLYVGAGMSSARPPDSLWWPLFNLWAGWPFALSLLSILLAHELGHYFVGRHHRVPVSLPYFVPLPIPEFLGNVLGTLGAVIRMKAPVSDRRSMLDIGAAGPIIGLIVAIPVLLIGLSLSHVEPLPVDQAYSMEGNSLLYLLAKYAIFRRWLPTGGLDVFISPVAFAGWAGLLVTSLNLIPAGQLDGGHVLYSLLGDRARLFTWPIIIALAALGLLAWPGWFLWAGLVFLFGQGHPGPLDSVTRLDLRRKVLAVAVLAIFVLTFTPIPLTLVFPSDVGGESVRGAMILVSVVAGLGLVGRGLHVRRRRG
jgi:membrane-associated protease RseP (regulator of RpoE activity)